MRDACARRLDPKRHSDDPLPWPERLRLLRDVALAVEALHAGGVRTVLHRNIHPSNVLLMRDHRAKLAGFGVSAALDGTCTATARGAVSLRYAAPETLAMPPSFRASSDVYSFGMLAYHVAAGHAPWVEVPQEHLVAQRTREGGRPSLAALEADSECPAALQTLLTQCWSQDCDDRPDAVAVVEALEEMVAAASDSARGILYALYPKIIQHPGRSGYRPLSALTVSR